MEIDKLKIGTYVRPNGAKIIIHEITGYNVFYSFNEEKEKNWGYYESILTHLRCCGFKFISEWD